MPETAEIRHVGTNDLRHEYSQERFNFDMRQFTETLTTAGVPFITVFPKHSRIATKMHLEV